MSVMSMFQNMFNGGQATPAPAAPAPQQAMPQPGNLPANAPAPADANNVNTPSGANPAPADLNNPASGLDEFKDLWAAPQSSGTPQNNQLFNLDPNKLMEAAGRMDFSKAVSPEQLQAISSGGPDAVQAFATAMNKVAQTVYAQSAMATTKIVEQAINKTKSGFINELPQHIKRQQASDALRTDNPAFNHPAAAPILGALQQQLSVKYPNATATELAGMARSYLENFSNMAVPQKQSTSQQAAPGETDWSQFL